MNYAVSLTIDIDADTHQEAAEIFHAALPEYAGLDLHYDVVGPDEIGDEGKSVYVSPPAPSGIGAAVVAIGMEKLARIIKAHDPMVNALSCAEEFLSNNPRNDPGDGTLGVIQSALKLARG
jgi:hypothetical protein